jgi:hypothetical protein
MILILLPVQLPGLKPNFIIGKERSMQNTKQLFIAAALSGALAAFPVSTRAESEKAPSTEKNSCKGSAGGDKHPGKDKGKEKKEGAEKGSCSGKGGCGGKAGCGGTTK